MLEEFPLISTLVASFSIGIYTISTAILLELGVDSDLVLFALYVEGIRIELINYPDNFLASLNAAAIFRSLTYTLKGE